MKLLNKLTLKNLRLNKVRTIVTIVGIMLSAALITVVSGMALSGRQTMIDGQTTWSGNYDVALDIIDTAKIDKIRQNRNVENAFYKERLGYARTKNADGEICDYSVLAMSENTYGNCFKIDLIKGKFPTNSGEAVVTKSFKTQDGKYVKVGDKHKSLEVDEYAANVVRDIFRKRLEGFSASHIADELNRLGILSPLAYKRNHGMPHAKGGYTDRKDCKWSATTIIRILQDETYTGTLVQGKQTTPHFKLKEREDKPSSEWIRVEGTHEAIIQKHDFDLVQRLRRIDTRTSPKSDKVYLFSGILICGCCGCRMTRKTNRYKDKEYHYYYCPTGKKNGCTSSVMLKESDLIECVQDSLKGHIENVASLDALLSSISQERINRELAQE